MYPSLSSLSLILSVSRFEGTPSLFRIMSTKSVIFGFFKAIWEDGPIEPSFEDGVYNNRVLDAVLESAEKESWINI